MECKDTRQGKRLSLTTDTICQNMKKPIEGLPDLREQYYQFFLERYQGRENLDLKEAAAVLDVTEEFFCTMRDKGLGPPQHDTPEGVRFNLRKLIDFAYQTEK